MLAAAVRRVLSALLVVNLVILLGGTLIWYLADGAYSLTTAWYFALYTVTTIGFGELPEMERHVGARSATSLIIITGVAALVYLQSALTTLLVEGTIGKAFRSRRMKNKIAHLSNHLVIAGCGRTGRYVIEELLAVKRPFVVIEKDQAVVEQANEEFAGKLLYIVGDATHDHTLIEAGVERAQAVVAALTDDRDNLFVSLSARSLNAKARIAAKVSEAENEPKLLKAGADKTVSPEHMGAMRLVSEVLRPKVTEFLDQMLRVSKNLRFEEVELPSSSSYVGKSLREVPIRERTNLLVVALHIPGQGYLYNPPSDQPLGPGTQLIVMGLPEDVQKLREMMAESAEAEIG